MFPAVFAVLITQRGLSQSIYSEAYTWNTIGGVPGFSGSSDGAGSTALFNHPQGLAVDGEGVVYVADGYNNTIRMMLYYGPGIGYLVSTPAGVANPFGGTNDGYAGQIQFQMPSGLAVPNLVGVNDVYVADTHNDTIRLVSNIGYISYDDYKGYSSTVAGTPGHGGYSDVPAQFEEPGGVAVDPGGNIYIADTLNCTIRKISGSGTVTTIAGAPNTSVGSTDGAGSIARFNLPEGLAVDAATNIFVADSFNNKIREITLVGTTWMVTTIAGSGNRGSADGIGTNASFYGTSAIAVDGSDNLYVIDGVNETIRKITPTVAAGQTNWVVRTIGGMAGAVGAANGVGSDARFEFNPEAIAVDNQGNVYVADTGNNTIREGVFTAYQPAHAATYNPPAMTSSLTVTLLPPEANGQWRFPWELGWHISGETESNLAAGNYSVELKTVPGWLAIPSIFTNAVTGATAITNHYYPTSGVLDTNNGGTLTVTLGTKPPNGAAWGFLGAGSPSFASGFSTNLIDGTYLIGFAPVNGYVTPPNLSVQVQAGQTTYLDENYLLAQSAPGGASLPFPVPSNEITDVVDYPFGFNGQLETDVGYGSGVAVQSDVVLTAAHLVFSDQTLSYASQAYWFFQEEAGTFQPQPIPARGWYVLSGYAEQRTNDLQVFAPDTSTPQSRNLDVAALYFQSPVAGGGYAGYLPSDTSPNPWLTSSANKMLVGYPVDGSEFGVTVSAGEMYQTAPLSNPLTLASDPVTDQQVYTASWFLSYPGNSGGPLYVDLNGYYYPAGVYLGTVNNGTEASAVRAIDSNVVNLITNAASLGDLGTNHTGGGVITIVPNQAISAGNPGYVQFQVGPRSAVLAGGGWRVQGDSAYSTATNYTRAIISTNVVAVEFKPIPGWNPPASQAIKIVPGQITYPAASYTVTNPVMVADMALGIGITGTTGTVYEIESRTSLTGGSWVPLSTNTILTNGFNLVTPRLGTNTGGAFYRAVWLGN